MIIVVKADGSTFVTAASLGYGSTVHEISVIAPWTNGTMTIAFDLPSGTLLEPKLCTPAAATGEDFGVWTISMTADITAESGAIGYQIRIVDQYGKAFTAERGTINVTGGISTILPSVPGSTTYADILAVLSAINTNYQAVVTAIGASTDTASATGSIYARIAKAVADISTNASGIASLGTSKVNVSDIVNDLTTGGATKVLTAEQGKTLKGLDDLKVPISAIVNDLTTGGTAVPLSAEQGKVLKGLDDLKVPISAIVNDLTTGGAAVPLSAEQGKGMNTRLTTAEGEIDTLQGKTTAITHAAGTTVITGNLQVDGATVQVDVESILTKDNIIEIASSDTARTITSDVGMEVKAYKGTGSADLRLTFDVNGYAKVGEAGDEQIIATREFATADDKKLPYWDDTAKTFKPSGATYDPTTGATTYGGTVKAGTAGTPATVSANNDLATKKYTDDTFEAKDSALMRTDEAQTMTADLTLKGNPTSDNMAANKKYVDDEKQLLLLKGAVTDNLFDKDSAGIERGGYYEKFGEDFVWVTNAVWCESDYIPIEANDKYYSAYLSTGNVFAFSNAVWSVFFDAGKNIVGGVMTSTNNLYRVPNDDTIKYLRIAIKVERLNSQIVAKSDTPPTSESVVYSPYSYVFKNKRDIEELQKTQWYGKTWYAYGTSLTNTASEGKYPTYVDQFSGMTRVNKGISGGALISNRNVYNAIMNTTDGKTDADLITLECMANDMAATFGTVSDTTDATFLGSLALCIQYLQENTDAQIVIILSPRARTDSGNNNANITPQYESADGTTYAERAKAIEELCQMYGVPFINTNYAGLGFYRKSDAYYVDNIHHTELGGYVYAKYIWAVLKNVPAWYVAIPS